LFGPASNHSRFWIKISPCRPEDRLSPPTSFSPEYPIPFRASLFDCVETLTAFYLWARQLTFHFSAFFPSLHSPFLYSRLSGSFKGSVDTAILCFYIIVKLFDTRLSVNPQIMKTVELGFNCAFCQRILSIPPVRNSNAFISLS